MAAKIPKLQRGIPEPLTEFIGSLLGELLSWHNFEEKSDRMILNCRNLAFSYDSGPQMKFPDFGCKKGEHLLLLGASGKGKTTLLHIMAGILKPNKGSVEIDGTDLTSLSKSKLDHFRGEKIGIVYQTAHFIHSLSVMDNLLMPQFLTGKPTSEEKALNLLQRLGIEHKAHKAPKNLSVGEQQRLAIARAIINDPALILADEPTSALDDERAGEVLHLLEEQARLADATLIIVTHDNRLKSHFENQIVL